MHTDDQQIGKILSRREALALFTATGTAFLAACAGLPADQAAPINPTLTQPAVTTPTLPTSTTEVLPTHTAASTATNVRALAACVVRPQQTEGPYFKDEMLNRSDIRSDPSDGSVKEGIPFELLFHVNRIDGDGCLPFERAVVDIWHCDAAGVYSDVNDPRINTVGQKFLRGYQETGPDGAAAFTTVFPGWYRGRTVHIHFKIRTVSASGEAYEFTSQLYFDDTVTDQIFQQAPYTSTGERTVRNSDDNLYRNGGDQLLLTPVETTQGYSAVFDIGLQMT